MGKVNALEDPTPMPNFEHPYSFILSGIKILIKHPRSQGGVQFPKLVVVSAILLATMMRVCK